MSYFYRQISYIISLNVTRSYNTISLLLLFNWSCLEISMNIVICRYNINIKLRNALLHADHHQHHHDIN